MSEWKKVSLDQMGTVSRGKSKHRPRNDARLFGGKYPFIQTGDISSAGLYVNEFSQTYNEEGLAQSKLWEKDTLCITIAANIADTALLAFPACFPDSIMGFVADHKKSNVKFVKYCFDILQKDCKQISQGAAQDNLSWKKLSTIEFPCPPIEMQNRIATILSRYDSLIENYQKQIKLLEEAAQRLYKEWFIDLHFPGHENTNIIDGVPEGWEKKKVGELLIKHIGGGWGKDTPTGSYDVGGHVIRGTDITQIENGNMNVPYRYHTESNLKDRRLKEGDIIFEVSGGSTNEPVGRTLFITNELVSYFGNNTICASFCKKMSFKTIQESVIAYFTIRYFRKIGYLHKYEKDSAGKIINYNWNDFLNEFDILFPNQVMLDNISARLQKIITEASKLKSQLRLLTEARDRLLPKLMSGAIEV